MRATGFPDYCYVLPSINRADYYYYLLLIIIIIIIIIIIVSLHGRGFAQGLRGVVSSNFPPLLY